LNCRIFRTEFGAFGTSKAHRQPVKASAHYRGHDSQRGPVAKTADPLLKPPGFKSSGRVCQTEPKYYRMSPHGSKTKEPPARFHRPRDDAAINRMNITVSNAPLVADFNMAESNKDIVFMVVHPVLVEHY